MCPTLRGYLTNLFDVADPEPELPRCSDHCDGGNTGSPPPPTRAGLSQFRAEMLGAEVGLLAGG